jgi:hypothetical protein
MRLVTSIFLTSVFIFPGIIAMLWFQGEFYTIKKKAKRQIIQLTDTTDLHVFTLDLSDTLTGFNWIHAGEFIYQGEMYDIVSRSYQKDSVTYHAWYDSEETNLKRKVNDYLANYCGTNQHHQECKSVLSLYLQALFWNETSTITHADYSRFRKPSTIFLVGYSFQFFQTLDQPPALS